MPIPEVTHLQYLVLEILLAGEITGREVREGLAAAGAVKSGPGFYQFMARLEDAKYVAGDYTQKVVEGQMIKERRYQITGDGLKALEETRRFYMSRGGLAVRTI